jgi:hypothetical protein
VPEKFVVTFKPGKEMENRVKKMATSDRADACKEMLRSQAANDPAPEEDNNLDG